jgi:hypothetical protein
VTVVHLLHVGDVVKPADDVGGPERLARLDLPAVQLLDETVVDLIHR